MSFIFLSYRVDWFNEFYDLTSYVDLDRFSNPHIRSTELVVEHHLGDYMIPKSYPSKYFVFSLSISITINAILSILYSSW